MSIDTSQMSPIEQTFWQAWCEHVGLSVLKPQYKIGPYRVDFAAPALRIAIELDGFASHSSLFDIAYDRKRQREIEALGWHIIRFGGQEIHRDTEACVREVKEALAAKYGKRGKMKLILPLRFVTTSCRKFSTIVIEAALIKRHFT